MRSVELQSQSWSVSDEVDGTDEEESAEDTEFSHLYARP